MNKFKLSKIYLENYKLFEKREIEFDKANLIVLDGPNGYGKTSVFEAIEYLLTGNIKRAEQCPEVSGKLGYDTHFLAKDKDKKVIISGELWSDNDFLKIERSIDVQNISGLQNNPKNLKNITQTKIWFNNEIEYDGSAKEADAIINEHFGGNLIEYYDNFYYISQEDRLKFLMSPESKRMEQINSLFSIDDEMREYAHITIFRNKLSKKITKLKKDNKDQRKKYEDYKKEMADKKQGNKEYKDIFKKCEKKPYWNESIVKIKEKEKLQEILVELKNAAMLSRNKEMFAVNLDNSQFESYTNDTELLEKLLIYSTLNTDLENEQQIFNRFEKLIELPTKEESEEVDVEKIKYGELKASLGIDVDIESIIQLQDEILKARKNQNTYNKSLERLQNARENLSKSLLQWKSDGGTDIGETICPYCGTDFKVRQQYEDAVAEAKKTLEECNDIETEKIKEYLVDLQKEFDEKFNGAIKEFLNRYSYMKNEMVKEILKNTSAFQLRYFKFREFLKKQQIDLEKFKLSLVDEKSWESEVYRFVEMVKNNYIKALSEEYLMAQKEYDFWGIYASVFNRDINSIDYISPEDEKEKRLYLEEQYQLQEYEKIKQMEEALFKSEKVVDNLEDLKGKVESVLTIYKEKIGEYQKRVIGEIQIPFYIYAGRVLQYYQGGLGIFIKCDTKDEKLESIRLLSSKQSDHDVLYTLSSGQLTGIIIAFTLTLNRIYGEDNFSCILIDDPVQTMDDLNIASLVELLRNEFKEYQLIISTHEEDFSRFIRYKYKMCNMRVKRYSLNE